MNQIFTFFTESTHTKYLVATLIVIIITYVLKYYFRSKIDKKSNLREIERLARRRSISLYINMIGLGFICIIWFTQIQAFLLSILAVAAALVLATKELIMSIMGGFSIKINEHFDVGDRIEINDIRGFVIEQSILVTKVLEIGPDKNSQQTTGNIISIPNSLVLNAPVRNESYFKNYSVKSFIFHLPSEIELEELETILMGWAKEICKDYINEAKRTINTFCRKEGLLIPAVEPRVKIILSEKNEFELILKLVVKNEMVGDIEQELNRKYYYLLKERNIKPIDD